MNRFDELKNQILQEFPSIKVLPWAKRVKAFFTEKSRHTWTIKNDEETRIWEQHATIVEVDGKFYIYCWGFEENPK